MSNNDNTHSMNPLLRKALVYSSVLMCVCIASAAGISVLYVANKKRIAKNKDKVFYTSLENVLGDATDVRTLEEDAEMGETDFYVASTEDGVRYVARGTARGYQSQLTVLVSIDADSARTPLPSNPTIYRAAVVSSQETPGLGENINKVEKDVSLWAALVGYGESGADSRPDFQKQFNNMRLKDLKVDKTGDTGITPITGATITSRGTTQAVRNAAEKLIEKTHKMYDTAPAANKDGVTESTSYQ